MFMRCRIVGKISPRGVASTHDYCGLEVKTSLFGSWTKKGSDRIWDLACSVTSFGKQFAFPVSGLATGAVSSARS